MPEASLLNIKNRQPYQPPVQVIAADGPVKIRDGGVVWITKGSVAAITLAAPVLNDVRLVIISTTAFAHTLTVAGGIAGAGSGADVGTFGGAAGDGVVLIARNGVWFIEPGGNTNVTFA